MSSAGLYAAASAAAVQQRLIDNIGNNVANLSTPGYKSTEVVTSDLFYNTLERAGLQGGQDGRSKPAGVYVGSGTKIMANRRNQTAGALKATGQNFDMALMGNGFFAVLLPNGKKAFTKCGVFNTDEDGILTTLTGEKLEGDGGEIQIPNNIDKSTVAISSNGEITARDNDNQIQQLGKVKIYSFANESGLEAVGSNLMLNTEASGDEMELADHNMIKHKYIEESNVNSVEALLQLMKAQNNYQVALKIINTSSEMEKSATEKI